MRAVNAVLCLLMLAFGLVQYNDPDPLLWGTIYMIPALWSGLAAWRPELLRGTASGVALSACLLATLVGLAYWWPREAGWWRQEVWWVSESTREGIGMMAVATVLLAVTLTRWRAGRNSRTAY